MFSWSQDVLLRGSVYFCTHNLNILLCHFFHSLISKDVFDQELHHHLEQVRMLELRLTEQQQQKEKAASAATAALTCCKEELEVCRKQCSEMKNKLGVTYQEVSTDHTPYMMGLGVSSKGPCA